MLWEGRLHGRVHGGFSEANLGTADKSRVGEDPETKGGQRPEQT